MQEISSSTLFGPCSSELANRAEGLIPAGSQTFSKGPTQFVRGFAPRYVQRAEGVEVWDVDGNRYIDWPMGLGAVVLGHAHPAVTAAVERQLADGIAYSLPHRLEVEVSELVRDLCPCAEMVRFGKTGSDAVSAAVRIARAATGREHVLHCGYHGWHDWHIADTTRDRGVPRADHELIGSFGYNDLTSLDAALAERDGLVAAVVMEPVGLDMPADGFLQGVIDRAHAAGAVVVFDEIITGFRLKPGGAQELFGVTPDLACYGKALGNGMPISAIAGKADLMMECEEIFFSLTHGGEALSLAAAKTVLEILRDGSVQDRFWQIGALLRDEQNRILGDAGLDDIVEVRGLGPRHAFLFSGSPSDPDGLLVKSLLQQEMLRRGVLFAGSQFVAEAHTETDVADTLAAFREAIGVVREARDAGDVAVRLEGAPVEAVFRRP
jgi:glutamate-1-semialdehyde aminotransferase